MSNEIYGIICDKCSGEMDVTDDGMLCKKCSNLVKWGRGY